MLLACLDDDATATATTADDNRFIMEPFYSFPFYIISYSHTLINYNMKYPSTLSKVWRLSSRLWSKKKQD